MAVGCYKSCTDWYNEQRLSRGQVNRVHSGGYLEAIGITRTLKQACGAPTNHYLLNPEKFLNSLAEFLSLSLQELYRLMEYDTPPVISSATPESSPQSQRKPPAPPSRRQPHTSNSLPQNQGSKDVKSSQPYKAQPGKFKNIQFRSQLEIRFAAELEKRGIHWKYEYKRLGDGKYLVDFYLPDLQIWVEVKGKFDARDYFMLPEVAQTLKQRDELLFVYSSSKAYIIVADSLFEIRHKNFWEHIESKIE